MAKCDLQIKLDRPSATYHPGETITGKVIVRVDADCRCNGLNLELGWTTHGSGDVDAQPVGDWTIWSGEWRAGQVREVPFELPSPIGPFTFRGHHVNVDWELRAQADIPWAFDPKAQANFILLPPKDAGLGLRIDHSQNAGLASMSRYMGIFGVVFAVIFLGIPIFGALSVFRDGGLIPGMLVGLFAMAFVGIGAYALSRIFSNQLATLMIGEVGVTVDPQRGLETGRIPVHVHVDGAARKRIRRVSAALIVRERCERGSGSDREVFSRDLHRDQQTLAAPHGSGGGTIRYDGELAIPTDATLPYSFKGQDNWLEWLVEVHIDLPRWPDYTLPVAMVAVPTLPGVEG